MTLLYSPKLLPPKVTNLHYYSSDEKAHFPRPMTRLGVISAPNIHLYVYNTYRTAIKESHMHGRGGCG